MLAFQVLKRDEESRSATSPASGYVCCQREQSANKNNEVSVGELEVEARTLLCCKMLLPLTVLFSGKRLGTLLLDTGSSYSSSLSLL